MDDLEVDLDDAPARPDEGLRARRPGWSGRVVLLAVAAVAVTTAVLVVPRTLPEEPGPRVTVDYVSPFAQDGRQAVDLHEDGQGRPTGRATLTVAVEVTALDVPPGVRDLSVTGPTGPALAVPARGTGLPVGAATGWKGTGTLELSVACDDLPDAVGPSAFSVPVTYARTSDARTTTATGSLTSQLPGLLSRVCAARTLRGDVGVVGVEALPGRTGLRVTVENRSRRTVWLRSVLDGGTAVDSAGPGTSVHVVRFGGTACVLLSMLVGGGVVSADGTTRTPTDRASSLQVGVMAALSRDAVGPDGAVMPIGLSKEAEQAAGRAMKRICGA